MKKINFLKFATVIAIFILVTVPQSARAQMSKKQEKQLSKEYGKQCKKVMNTYNKEGWKLSGSSRSLEVALLEHYQKTADPKNVEFVGEVSQCKSINVCKQFALTNAQNRYVLLASGHVKGRIESLLRADANMPEIEIDKFIAAYENQVKAEVGGALTESYSIVKDNGDTKEYKTFFILNEEKASQIRARALERSLKETKITIKEAEEISKFVNEGFNLE
jgi:hypothetical protein